MTMLTTLSTLLAALLLVPGQASPELESATFTVSVDGNVIGTEEFSILRSGDGYLTQATTRFQLDGQTVRADSTLRLDAGLRPLSYEYRSGDQRLEFTIAEPTTEVRISVNGSDRALDLRLPADGAIIDDNFFHHYLILLYRFGGSGGMVPTFVPQQMTLGSLTVTGTGPGTYAIETDNLRLEATTDAGGRLIRLEVPDANVVVER
jgi:hypothetical protein